MKIDLSTGSPAADTLLGLMVVGVFAVWLLAAETAVWLIRDRKRGK